MSRTRNCVHQGEDHKNVIRGCFVSRLFPFIVGLPFFVNVMGAGLIRMGKVRSVSYHESGQTLPVGLFVVVLFSFFLVLRSLAVGAIRSRVSDCGA